MKKVLIAEDSRTFRTALLIGLKKYQDEFLTLFAADGLEAMNILQGQPVDLVVTDVHMPMMDGLVLLAFMLENCPETPCIVMSAYGDRKLKDMLKPDILTFIDKPVDPEDLARMILSAIKAPPSRKSGRKTISVVDLMNLILVGDKTCVFNLKTKEGASGICYFHEGEFYNAVCGALQGERAFEMMLGWTEADIRFMKTPKTPGEKKIRPDMPEMIERARASRLTIRAEKEK